MTFEQSIVLRTWGERGADIWQGHLKGLLGPVGDWFVELLDLIQKCINAGIFSGSSTIAEAQAAIAAGHPNPNWGRTLSAPGGSVRPQ